MNAFCTIALALAMATRVELAEYVRPKENHVAAHL